MGLSRTPAFAQDEGRFGDEGNSDAIIVTARRTEERLQDVPISITVFTQEAISNRNVVTASTLRSTRRRFRSTSASARKRPRSRSRGFNQDNSTAPTVGAYFADVVAPRVQGGTAGGNVPIVGSFMDLQNVQVLKGPQGTLFGRNTTGGAVLLVPTKPKDKFEGWVEGSARPIRPDAGAGHAQRAAGRYDAASASPSIATSAKAT